MPWVAVAALITAAAGTALSITESRRARKQQKRAAQVSARRRALESRKATVAGIEDARQMIGTVQNVAGLTGAQGGSGAQGSVGSLMTQMGTNATFNQQLLQFSKRQEQYMQKAMDAQYKAQTFSAIAGLAMSVASFSAAGAKPKADGAGKE